MTSVHRYLCSDHRGGIVVLCVVYCVVHLLSLGGGGGLVALMILRTFYMDFLIVCFVEFSKYRIWISCVITKHVSMCMYALHNFFCGNNSIFPVAHIPIIYLNYVQC